MVDAETKEENNDRISAHTDVEVELDNDEYRSKVITLEDLLDNRIDNIDERETIQKEFNGRIPEWRSIKKESKSFLIRKKLGNLTGSKIIKPSEWKEGDGKIISDEESFLENMESLISDAKAVEIEELTGTEYQLVQGEENRYEHSVDGKWFYNYLSTRERNFFHNVAFEYNEETGQTIFETDLIFRWPRHEVLEEADFDDLDVWRFTGVLNGEPDEQLDFVIRSNPESEKGKVENYFGEETYELFEEAGFLEEKDIWKSGIRTNEYIIGDELEDLEKDVRKAEPFYENYIEPIRRFLEDLPKSGIEARATLNGDETALGRDEILEIFEEEFADIEEQKDYLFAEVNEDGSGGKCTIKYGKIQQVKYRIERMRAYPSFKYQTRSEDRFPDNIDRRQEIREINLEDSENELEIFWKN